MTTRHLRLIPVSPAQHPAPAPTPADRIRQAARRLGAIGREMASQAAELRGLTDPYLAAVVVKEAS